MSIPKIRSSSADGHLVPVDELQVGDQLRYRRGGEVVWCPILDFEELAQHRRIIIKHFNGESSRLRRRTTLVVRAARASNDDLGGLSRC
jgi:hypothetical protein